MITIILLVFFVFITRAFYLLVDTYKKNILLHTFLGVLSYFGSYVISTLFIVIAFSISFKGGAYENETVISCFTIPFAVLISGIHYKVLESWLKKNEPLNL